MGDTRTSTSTIRFGEYEADPRSGELRRNGVRVKLQEQPFQILAALLERPGEVFTREELCRRLWPADTFVDFDHSLNTAVKKLREALGDSADHPRYVETLPRRGYRFIARVGIAGTTGLCLWTRVALASMVALYFLLGTEFRPHRDRVNPEAYQSFLRGRYFLQQGKGTYPAIPYLERAVSRAPDYAPAYANLAEAYMFGLPPKVASPKARSAALRAVSLDGSLAKAHVALGMVKTQYDWDWAGGEAEFRRALRINPDLAEAHHRYAFHLAAVGRLDDAVSHALRARDLDPFSLLINADLGRIYYFARQYDQAIRQLKDTLELDANHNLARRLLGQVYERTGKYDLVMDQWLKTLAIQGADANERESLERLYAAGGVQAISRRQVQSLRAWPDRAHWSACLARYFEWAGERDQAFEWLETAFQNRAPDLIYLKVEPAFDSMRSDARFQDLVRRVGLP